MTEGNHDRASKSKLSPGFSGKEPSPSDPKRRVSAVRLALALKRLREETADLELFASEPIAIIGLGCRFPGGASDPEKYWEMLNSGVDAIRRVPEGRWPFVPEMPEHLHYGGYLDEIDSFDALSLKISPREAYSIDPQQRLLLEVTWEALWNAGIESSELSGKAVGVFAAIYNSDYSRMQLNRAAEPVANAANAAHSVAAGRISFLLNLTGPCMAIDTACSSSLVAIHLACQSLRARECDTAISGGVSLKVLPDELLVLDRLGMLSRTSRCRTFDEKADGFVPGEGCGVVVLKRLSDALAARDPIRAVIRGTAVNHDGRTSVLTAPSGLAHEAVIRQALKNGAVEADEISYVEAHGTGTSLGDPIELQALQSVYGAPATTQDICVLGAVKSNLGHLEAAAGFAGLIKVVLSMEHGSIPKNLHFMRLNPQSSLAGTRLKIAQQNEVWPRGSRARLAGVSSLGFGGTNAHVIVEEAPVLPGTSKSPLLPRAWKRSNYWLPPAPTSSKRTQIKSNPLNGMWLASPFLQGKVFAIEMDDAAIKYAREHFSIDEDIVLAPSLLELIYPVVQEAVAAQHLRWFDVRQSRPISLTTTKQVQIAVDSGRVSVVSETQQGWQTHLTAGYEISSERLAEPLRKRGSLLTSVNPENLTSRQIEACVRKEAVAVMEMLESDLPVDIPLINLGLDSMMAVDLRNRLQALIGQELPPNFIFHQATVAAMAEEIGARLWAAQDGVPSSANDQREEVEL